MPEDNKILNRYMVYVVPANEDSIEDKHKARLDYLPRYGHVVVVASTPNKADLLALPVIADDWSCHQSMVESKVTYMLEKDVTPRHHDEGVMVRILKAL